MALQVSKKKFNAVWHGLRLPYELNERVLKRISGRYGSFSQFMQDAAEEKCDRDEAADQQRQEAKAS